MVRNFTKTHQIIALAIVFFLSIFSVLTSLGCVSCRASAGAASSARCTLEAESLRVLEENNAHVRLPMASTTKTMTAYLALTEGDPESIVTIPTVAQGVEGSSIYLKAGERWKLEDLVYGLMLRSGNDAAVAIAVHLAGSVERFADRMNEKAIEWGLKDTHFVNPHGLHHPDHYTSAYDLAVIGARAMRFEPFRKIVSTKTVRLKGNLDSDEFRIFGNKNKILSNYDGGNGIKTGYTKTAGRCLIAASERDGMQVVSVVLNVPDMFEVCSKMMDRAHNNYRMEQVTVASEACGTACVTTKKGTIEVPLRTPIDLCVPIKKDGSEQIHTEFLLPKGLSAPIAQNSCVGQIAVMVENHLIFSEKIFTMIDVI